jgi:hypothetical protein
MRAATLLVTIVAGSATLAATARLLGLDELRDVESTVTRKLRKLLAR